MIKLKEILMNEKPIDNYSTIGDFEKGSSFTHPVDRKLITNPVSIQKVKDFFKNTSVDFDFYFVNTKEARKFFEEGDVDEHFIFDELKIKPEQLKNGRINKDNITIFFTNNKGDERYPMTAWIMAHRLGHVVRKLNGGKNYSWGEYAKWVDKCFRTILAGYGFVPGRISRYEGDYMPMDAMEAQNYKIYAKAKRHLAEALGTFKSARDKNLRQEFEFLYEWFALYLKTGATPLNPPPEVIVVGHGAYGRENKYRVRDKEIIESGWRELVNEGNYYIENILSEATGRIFVM